MSQNILQQKQISKILFSNLWLPKIFWGFAIVAVGFALSLVLYRVRGEKLFETPVEEVVVMDGETETIVEGSPAAVLPYFEINDYNTSIPRAANPHTIIPAGSRDDVALYTVQPGDSVFSIANRFDVTPETVLWANYAILNDNPDALSVGQELTVPPVNGVYYKWKQYDDLNKIAGDFKVDPQDILLYPGNNMDLTNPVLEPDNFIMIPGGSREFRQWVVPTIWRANAGASQSISGPGGCQLPDGGYFGSGSFVWPTGNHALSPGGNDYYSGHLGLDLAAAEGAPLYAVDSGLVVYAGSISGGYGIMVMIDHGTGYHSLYAHMSQLYVSCGSSVTQGQMIGLSGNTGNSTGPHLHFELRYNGGFINPWYVLP
ncbi:MAG: M23 family metallopeptidase [Anaerolineaceae bacterium]|nr:M23 family metallopeptidase [Anaerolineaceae bacterium]